VGGATLFHRIKDYLYSKFRLRYEDMHAILDWGCGAGRLLSHFAGVAGPEIWGGDVDRDNVRHCQEHYSFARCLVFPLFPPTQIQSGKFDLVVGISVCSHLSEENQQRWLSELRRIIRPGGLLLLSVQGRFQAGLYRESPALMRAVERSGFVVKGTNPRINADLEVKSYYLDVVQSREHILENWGRDFDIVEFLDGMAANQDLVVMRARKA
jgi:SAM-dependent methyltransferase